VGDAVGVNRSFFLGAELDLVPRLPAGVAAEAHRALADGNLRRGSEAECLEVLLDGTQTRSGRAPNPGGPGVVLVPPGDGAGFEEGSSFLRLFLRLFGNLPRALGAREDAVRVGLHGNIHLYQHLDLAGIGIDRELALLLLVAGLDVLAADFHGDRQGIAEL